MGRGGAVVRTLDSQSREPGFESSCCRFEALAISFIPRCHSSLNCIDEYLATERERERWTWKRNFCAVIAAWLNASRKSRYGFGMNSTARGACTKYNGLDIKMYLYLFMVYIQRVYIAAQSCGIR